MRAWNKAPAARVACVKAAYEADDMPVREIALAFNLHPRTVQAWARRHGWTRRHPDCVVGQHVRFARPGVANGAMALA